MVNAVGIEVSSNVFYENFVNQFIIPEVKRRQAEGILPAPVELKIARVIFCLGNPTPIIQINDEIGPVDIKLKEGISKKAGEPIFENEIDWKGGISLPEKYENCAHQTVIFIGKNRYMLFDFRYNKAKCRNLVNTSRQFYDVASHALNKKFYSPFIDNLHSASELAAMSMIIALTHKDKKALQDHKSVHDDFNEISKDGKIDKKVIRAFNKLDHERNPARYLKGRDKMYELSDGKAQRLLANTCLLIDEAEILLK